MAVSTGPDPHVRSCLVALAFAGVFATSLPAWAQADTTAPTVLSFTYAVTPPAYSEAAAASVIAPGTRITLDLTANETVTRGLLQLFGPTALTLNRTGGSGSRVLWVIDFPRALPAGTYSAAVDLTDAAGNTARRNISLPAPGFVVTNGVDSPCLITDASGVQQCSDADGDGAPGRSAVCNLGGDCDDTNPTIRSFAPEIAGDGVDNSCSGGTDAPVIEQTGVFVAPFPSGGAITPPGTIAPARNAVWYDYTSSCTLFQDDDGGLYFWDAAGVRGKQSCAAYNGNLVNPSRTATSIGACWVPIWAKNGSGTRIITPIAGLAPGAANSEVSFSNATNCNANSGSAGSGACVVSWLPRNTAVTANLGTAGSAWYTGAATVTVRKPAWGTECPRPGSPSDFTWSPPGLGTEDPSCTECNGTRAVWTMNRAAVVDQKWQYVDNPHAHPTVTVVHEGDFRGLSQIADANIPDEVSTIASEHWAMYTFIVLGSMTISASNELVLGAGTKKNGFPSLLVDVNLTLASNARLFAAGNVYVRNNVNGPEKLTSFSERFLGSADSVIENGTRAHPYRTFRRGVDEARAVNKVVFVALGAYDDGGPGLVIDVPVLGGFVSTGWTRVPLVHSFVALNNPATITSDLVIGFDLDMRTGNTLSVQSASGLTTLIDTRIIGDVGDSVNLFGAVRSVRTDVESASLNVNGTLVAARGEFSGVVRSTNATMFQRTIFAGPVDVASGTFVGTRAVFEATVTAGANTVSRLSQSTFLNAAPAIDGRTAGVITLANNLFAGSGTDVQIGPNTITLTRSNLFEGDCPVTNDGTCALICGENGNRCQAAGLVPGDHHLAAGSAAIDAGSFIADLTPTVSVLDLDGQCINGATDLGADER